jgi:fibronectin type 3 domain-containing protein
VKTRSRLYAASLIILILSLFLTAHNGTRAISTFQTTWGGKGIEVGQSVALDSQGEIYVTGYTNSFTSSGVHVFLLKLDRSGVILWQRIWEGSGGSEYGKGVGVDSLGNIYVTGYTDSFGNGENDVFLLKWNSSGALLWQRTWTSPGENLGLGLAVNASNNIYVTGYSTITPSGTPKVILLNFDANGNLLWQREWGGNGTDEGESVAIDAVGGVYVTGFTSSVPGLVGAVNNNVLLLKFNSTGNLSWQRVVNGTRDDEGYAVTTDLQNNAYVTGATQSTGAGNDDVLLMKFDTLGNVTWQETWGGGNTDQGQGITVDRLGYVYVTGFSSSFGGGGGHAFLLSLNYAGRLLWQTIWGAQTGLDSGFGAAAAGSGYVVATGFVSESSPYSFTPEATRTLASSLGIIKPQISLTTLTFGASTPTGIVAVPNGSTNYAGGQDAFVLTFGSPTPPTAPRNLVAVGYQGYVNLTWQAPEFNGFNPITGYNIYRSTVPGSEAFIKRIGNQTFYTDSAIIGGITYYYKVSAINDNGTSVLSSEAPSTPNPTTVPTPPQNLAADASTGHVHLSWVSPASNGGSALTGYNVYRGPTSGTETLLATLSVQNTYDDLNIVGGVRYFYQVTALNAVGESSRSNEVNGTPVTPPSPPLNLKPTVGFKQIILTWSTPTTNGGSAVTGYIVYRGTSSGSEAVYVTLPVQLSYTDNRVNTTTTYFYEVTATNEAGSSGFSNEVSGRPSSNPSVPSAPLNLVAKAGKNNVTLTWSVPLSNGGSSISGYDIYRSTTSGKEMVVYPNQANTTTFTDTIVTAGVTYYYEVAAFNSNGEGALSNEANATPFTTPSAPRNLQAYTGQGEIILTWNPPTSNGFSSITGYRIYRNSTFLTLIGNQTYYFDTTATPGDINSYNVSAVNAAGTGPQSTGASAFASARPVPPSPPQGLTATPGNGTMTLNWTKPYSNGGSSITGYEVWRGTASGSETRFVSIGNVTSYVDTSVLGGTHYYYFVKAINSIGASAGSNEANATPTSIPSAPGSLTATAGAGEVILNWTTPSSNGGLSILGYKIYRSTSSGTETLIATVNDGTQLSYVDTQVTPGTTYFYKVAAFNSLGTSKLSNEASATPTQPITPPGQPTNLVATPGVDNITLTWTPPANNGGAPITSYQIWRGTTSGSETMIATTSMTTYTDTGLTPGTTYYYYVIAVNSAGSSPKSQEVSAAPPTAPGIPQNLTATPGINSINLTWSPPASNGGSPITGYIIYRGTAPGSETLYKTVGTVTTYLDQSVTSGTTYYYKIEAVNAVGPGNLSAETSASTITTPSQPTNLIATPGVNNITLTWSPPSNTGGATITSYQIFRGTISGQEVMIASTTLTTYTDTGLASGTPYYYYVVAVNSAGPGAQSQEVSGVPLAPETAPSSPLNLQATAGIDSVNLTWTPPISNGGSPITGYAIYRGTSPGSETLYQSVGLVYTYHDVSVTSGTTYYYKIVAINGIGPSGSSNEVSATPLTPPPPASFPIIPVAIAALVIVAVGAVGVIYWRRRVSQRMMMPP